ncbi:hypothetical protein [Burkholderia contaminans]|uniref:hypothetical protein n=1 Tax=Burkholderia contaminans TaxID=488447 RepID=UPI003D66C491
MQTLRAAMQKAREAGGKQVCRGMAGWRSTAEIAAIVCGGVTLSIEPMQTLRAAMQKAERPELAGLSDDGRTAVDPGGRRHRLRIPRREASKQRTCSPKRRNSRDE